MGLISLNLSQLQPLLEVTEVPPSLARTGCSQSRLYAAALSKWGEGHGQIQPHT